MLLKNPLAGLPLLEIPGPWRRGTRPLPALARPCQTLPTCQTSRKNHGGNESMEELCREWGAAGAAHAVPMLAMLPMLPMLPIAANAARAGF